MRLRHIVIGLCLLLLCGCNCNINLCQTPELQADLAQGKRLFKYGYYKQAMRDMMPLACNGVCEAEYAVGYMYYYGFGVKRDTENGIYWIRRSAAHGYKHAKDALRTIHYDENLVSERRVERRKR